MNGNLITDLVNNPIMVSIPFDSSSSVSPDTIALVDSAGAIAFLPTSVVGNTLQAQVMHLSYILSLRNNTPIVVNSIADVVVDEDSVEKIIDLSSVFADIDLVYGDQLSLSVTSGNSSLLTASVQEMKLKLTF